MVHGEQEAVLRRLTTTIGKGEEGRTTQKAEE